MIATPNGVLTGGLSAAAQVVALMRSEADAIQRAADRTDPDTLHRVVTLLAACRGLVVVSGVGKSGIVARKIAATLTSTGTRALFLHPGDALHGDLGILGPSDAVMLLSNSGESEEILALLPALRHRGVPIVALVGNIRSTLACSADLALDTSVDREACPYNLAPSASTAVALALGDALALAAMQARGFTPTDFARNHPAGRLGKRLTLRVKDLMHHGANQPVVAPGAPLDLVLDVLCARSLGAVNVLDEEGRLVGLVTDGDIRRSLRAARSHNLASLTDLTAQDIMTRRPVVVGPEVLAYEALQLMENRPSQISVLPVVDDTGRGVGLLRLHDIVRRGLA